MDYLFALFPAVSSQINGHVLVLHMFWVLSQYRLSIWPQSPLLERNIKPPY